MMEDYSFNIVHILPLMASCQKALLYVFGGAATIFSQSIMNPKPGGGGLLRLATAQVAEKELR
jgi:hypothetical protein